jgi:hypothetical protein
LLAEGNRGVIRQSELCSLFRLHIFVACHETSMIGK